MIRRQPARISSSPYGQAGAVDGKGKGKGKGKGNAVGTPGGLSMPLMKSRGQHLLKNPGILDKIIDAADIKSSDTVLEVGPGTGNLTVRILPLCKQMIAIEVDPRMTAEVKKRAQSEGKHNLEVIQGDALRTPFPPFHVCAANLPYQISSPFIFKILAHRPLFRCAVLMFQLEFAERLVAEPGGDKYGRLAVNTRLLCKVTRVFKVTKGNFNPPPEVDSMIVKIVPRDPPIDVNFREFDGLLRVLFVRKHKQVSAAFKPKAVIKVLEDNHRTWCAMNNRSPVPNVRKLVEDVLKESQMGEQRSFRLEIDAFLQLLLKFNAKGIHFSNVAAPSSQLDESALAEMAAEEDAGGAADADE